MQKASSTYSFNWLFSADCDGMFMTCSCHRIPHARCFPLIPHEADYWWLLLRRWAADWWCWQLDISGLICFRGILIYWKCSRQRKSSLGFSQAMGRNIEQLRPRHSCIDIIVLLRDVKAMPARHRLSTRASLTTARTAKQHTHKA